MGREDPTSLSEQAPTQGASAGSLVTIAKQLAELAVQIREATGEGAQLTSANDVETVSRDRLLWLARVMYDQRRRRNAIIGGPELFGEPAWDILLDLYIAHAQGKRVSVSSACIGSSAPPTTGLRWLGVLQVEGLVLRENDPQDNRRVNVRLSDKGLSRMERYLLEVRA